jgi:hypothetical protein
MPGPLRLGPVGKNFITLDIQLHSHPTGEPEKDMPQLGSKIHCLLELGYLAGYALLV